MNKFYNHGACSYSRALLIHRCVFDALHDVNNFVVRMFMPIPVCQYSYQGRVSWLLDVAYTYMHIYIELCSCVSSSYDCGLS